MSIDIVNTESFNERITRFKFLESVLYMCLLSMFMLNFDYILCCWVAIATITNLEC